jgi:hypothetical protein
MTMIFHHLPISLVCLLAFYVLRSSALVPSDITKLPSLFSRDRFTTQEKRTNYFDTNRNGTAFLWIIQDTYSGKTFFDRWSFYDQGDPTHGTVNYVNASTAFSSGLAYVLDNGKVVMKGDNTSWLAAGQNRNSVRISSNAQYQTGLFILDVDRAPWGCGLCNHVPLKFMLMLISGVWPAFWTIGNGQWPYVSQPFRPKTKI